MKTINTDIAVIGGGPAGLAAAIRAGELGANVVLIERDFELGGILNQCIHPGFGLSLFGIELTGPEYAERFIEKIYTLNNIKILLSTMIIDIQDKVIYGVNRYDGAINIRAKAIILSMGCRERTRGALGIPGERPVGIYTAGSAQRLINIEGLMPGKRVVILGSGDIGMIMARRFVLEGAEVFGVLEKLPYPGGLTRNVVQCLEDFNIPLYLNHTVTEIKGKYRLEGVIAEDLVNRKKFSFDVDTLLLSVGLIPENELSRKIGVLLDPKTGGPVVTQDRETSISGVFACGNVLQVHDLVDEVTKESYIAAEGAVKYISGEEKEERITDIGPGGNIRYIVPQRLKLPLEKPPYIYFRPLEPLTDCQIVGECDGRIYSLGKTEYARPGEIIKLRLKKELLDSGSDIKIRLEGEKV
jgi:NADPH-dependent 2,4-dienoyl-CoA reductase/sulfur reductase-like enzyme